jgi:two-component system, cell cycle sensor histidine kinase and response regulator CckA
MKYPENLKPAHVDQTVILIAEDEVLVANVARIVLEIEGYFILTASDGEDALFISRQYPGPIHLLLSDVKMPRLNGLELTKHIMKERSDIKILLMTGDTEPVGKLPVLRKPFLPHELRAKVRQMFERAVLFPT